jgi:hypothetical protein
MRKQNMLVSIFSFSRNAENSEIYIPGIATPRKHSLPTKPKCREEKRAWVYEKMVNKAGLRKNETRRKETLHEWFYKTEIS